MAILGMWTADLQDLYLPGMTPAAVISSTQARTGIYSYRKQWNYKTTFSFTEPSLDFYYRMGFYFDGSGLESVLLNILRPGEISLSYTQCRIYITPNYLQVYTGEHGAEIANSACDTSLNTWHMLEAHIVIHDTTGVAQIKWDDQLLIDASGVDTQDETNGYAQHIHTTAKCPVYMYLDDIMARDDDWCGAGGLHVLVPNSGSATEDWTASAGNPEDCVDELPVSFDDYISTNAATSNTEHLFNLTSLSGDSLSIGGVGIFANVKAVDTTSSKVMSLLKSGSTQVNGSGTLLQSSPGWITTYYEQNPDDAADWETADIDALQIGVETE